MAELLDQGEDDQCPNCQHIGASDLAGIDPSPRQHHRYRQGSRNQQGQCGTEALEEADLRPSGHLYLYKI